MNRFFGKLRYNLLKSYELGKYFKYAIGEIILVMIGIILAVQVNQWLENRKLKIKEKETVKLLLRDLKIEKDRLLFYQYEINKHEQSIIRLLKAINDNEPIDSVHFYVKASLDRYVFKPFKPIYQGLIQNGELNLIKNQELRDFLVNHFEETNNYLSTLIRTQDERSKVSRANLEYYFPLEYHNNGWIHSKTSNSKNVFSDPKIIQTFGSLASMKNWLSHRIDTYFIVRSDSLSNSLNTYLKTLE